MEPRITLITLGVSDLERSLRFYRDGLGWPLSGASVPGEVAFFHTGGATLGLYPQQLLTRDANLPDTPPAFGGIALAHNVRSKGGGGRGPGSRGGYWRQRAEARRGHALGRLCGLLCGPRRPRVGSDVEPRLPAAARRQPNVAGVRFHSWEESAPRCSWFD